MKVSAYYRDSGITDNLILPSQHLLYRILAGAMPVNFLIYSKTLSSLEISVRSERHKWAYFGLFNADTLNVIMYGVVKKKSKKRTGKAAETTRIERA